MSLFKSELPYSLNLPSFGPSSEEEYLLLGDELAALTEDLQALDDMDAVDLHDEVACQIEQQISAIMHRMRILET